MDNETHLHLLQLLQRQPDLSQRQLARALGISLGKTNYCLKALVEKGWIKADNFRNSQNKAKYLYVLTPRGLAGKARLTLRFLRRKEAEYQTLMHEIAELRQQVAEAAQQGGEC
ncbi:MAG: MarR family EPS-associated transcriptional regulator [Ottowia sp.]|nr:MarR family EPS-associated transcriptional regulator [Ottowia sp.]